MSIHKKLCCAVMRAFVVAAVHAAEDNPVFKYVACSARIAGLAHHERYWRTLTYNDLMNAGNC